MEQAHERSPDAQLHQELDKLARKHLGGNLGLQLLPYDPDQYPDQLLDTTYHEVDPSTNLETLRFLATLAMGGEKSGRFEQLVDGFTSRPDLLNHIRIDLKDGKNIALISDHSSLEGIAYMQAGLITALGDEKLVHSNAIMLSKLLTRLSIFGGQPATEVLSKLGRSVFSVPRTKSIFRSGIDNDVATHANQLMLAELHEYLRPGGRIVALSPSGSLDERTVSRRGRLQSLNLQRMSSGTAYLLSQFDRVLPTAMWLDAAPKSKWFTIGEVSNGISRLDEGDAAHQQMDWIASELSHLAGVPAEYEHERMSGIERALEIGRGLGREALDGAQRIGREIKDKI